ncbi:hypothetical protein [Salegentibacter sp. BLCTC]|uniref:hypothetical protein n=1 Tax=Salegentibacter sp. BLCTC TaxID=2697368 RepID=UPI00351C3E6E
MTLSPEEINSLISNPCETVDFANLTYVSEEKLSINRKKMGRGFSYINKGKRIQDPDTIKRIKNLAIPPAWQEVKITHLKNGHLQVVGRDEKIVNNIFTTLPGLS